MTSPALFEIVPMFVVLLTYVKPMDEVEAVTAAHRAWLDPHVATGLLIATGPQVPRTGGVLLARGGGSKTELEALLKSDPFQIAGVAAYQVIEFTPGKYHPDMAQFL